MMWTKGGVLWKINVVIEEKWVEEREIGRSRGQGSFMSGHVFNIPRVGGGVDAAAGLINLHREAVLRGTDVASVRNVRH